MRLVFLGPFGLAPKGTMRARALPLARALARAGHEVTLLMPPWQQPETAGRAWDDAVPGVRLVNVSLAGLGIPLLGHLLVAGRLARAALALRPDAVHAFKPKAYSHLALLALRWRRLLPGAPAFRLVMDTDDWEGRGGWNDLEPYPVWQKAFFRWQERVGLGRHADAVTVASRSLETLVWSLGVPQGKVLYLPNAVDDSLGGAWAVGADGRALGDEGEEGKEGAAADQGAMQAAADPAAVAGAMPGAGRSDASGVEAEQVAGSLGAAEGRSSGAVAERSAPASSTDVHRPPCLLLYTRFFEFGLPFLLDVLAAVREQVPDCRLLVLGRGLFGEERELARLAAARGLAEAIDDRGWVQPEQLPALFAGADLALYPFDDSLVNRSKASVKLLELMAAGLPVVASAVGQNAEVIQDGRSGLLVPPGDAAAFARAVLDLLADPVRRAALGTGAAERVRESFRWSLLVERVLPLYAGGAGGQGGARPEARPRA